MKVMLWFKCAMGSFFFQQGTRNWQFEVGSLQVVKPKLGVLMTLAQSSGIALQVSIRGCCPRRVCHWQPNVFFLMYFFSGILTDFVWCLKSESHWWSAGVWFDRLRLHHTPQRIWTTQVPASVWKAHVWCWEMLRQPWRHWFLKCCSLGSKFEAARSGLSIHT